MENTVYLFNNYFDWDDRHPIKQVIREQPKIGRNEKCPCGSGLKYKNCCKNKGE